MNSTFAVACLLEFYPFNFSGVHVIRFAVIRSQESVFWQGITHLLQADSRTDVSVFGSLNDLAERPGDPFDVTIIPWSRSADGYPWLDRVGEPRSRAVIGVDDTANEAVFWVREIDRSLLLDLSERLSRMGLIERSSMPNVIALAPEEERTGEHLTPVRELLGFAGLIVRKRLAGDAQGAADAVSPIPGWTASHAQVRDVIGGRSGETREDVQSALSDIERKIADGKAMVDLGSTIRLSPLEQRILALALAPELDGRFQAAFGYLHNDLTRGYASVALLSDLLAGPDVDALTIRQMVFEEGPIAQFRLLDAQEGVDGRIGPESALRVPADVIDVLLKGRFSDRDFGAALSLTAAQTVLCPDSAAGAQLLTMIEGEDEPRPSNQLIQLIAPRPAVSWAETVLASEGHRVLKIDGSRLADVGGQGLAAFASKIKRLCRLVPAVPLLTGVRTLEGQVGDLAVLLLDRVETLIIDLEHPWTPPASVTSRLLRPFAETVALSASYWQAAARMHQLKIDEADVAELAATRRDDAAQVASILRHVAAMTPEGEKVTLNDLKTTAISLSAPRRSNLIRRISPAFTWDDIVLRADRLAQLHDITGHVRHAAKVMDHWGFAERLPYGRGVAALFSGPSGTGKTMAAQIIAADLGVEVFQVDLAKTVSKYIGETEKHLDAAFEDAERASAVLLFDEADALFGKRTEVKDAHDRHANVEVAYLLQRLEQFQGLVLLTTNFKQNIDAAFVRRLRFSVDFPSPDAGERLEIWRRAFPKATPTAKDLDLGFLADRFKLTGGHIQQIVLMAAFLAADDGCIEMAHVTAATRRQLTKLGMISAEKSLSDRGLPGEVLSA